MLMFHFLNASFWGLTTLEAGIIVMLVLIRPIRKEPEGGNSYSYASLEYTFKVADPLRLAIFYDGGYLSRAILNFYQVIALKAGMIIGV